jgi:hypothetical protein
MERREILLRIRSGYETTDITRLREALGLAVTIIENYQMDINDPQWTETIRNDKTATTLADVGFCQGNTYQDALPWIADILEGTRHFR